METPLRRTAVTLFLIACAAFTLLIARADDKPPAGAKPRATAPAKAEPKISPAKKSEIDAEAAVSESAQRFTDAYNRHDAKTIAAGFTQNAEFVTEKGTEIRGREAIERHFASAFAAAPQVHLELNVESIRLVTSNVAIEEGRVEMITAPGESPLTSRYVAVHVNYEGKWLLARARDFSADAEPRSNHERLKELEWLVGEWIEEGEGTLVATSCRWDTTGSYLLQDFTIRLAGHSPMTGSTRIGWDPQTQQIKSWTFDADGGYSEGLWTHGADKWVLKSRGVTHLGRNFSATSILRHVDSGTLSWESRDRVEGGVLVPDRPPLVVKRRPPPPGE
jgi:uncharacterized protein (TIGR02246 family)